MRAPVWSRAAWLQFALIVLVVAAVYGHTLDVPFYLDDIGSIRENDSITHWHGIMALAHSRPLRVVPYLSLAWNYRLGGLDPRGYHLFNLVVHALASLSLYVLARGLLRAPRIASQVPAGAREVVPLCAALIFALHPLHTEAVTYIVQRLASMVALFVLAALAAYVQARLATTRSIRVGGYATCGAAALLAFFSKENAMTLPIGLLLIEYVAFVPSRGRLLAMTAAAAAAASTIVIAGTATAMNSVAHDVPAISRPVYLATQFVIVPRYLGLFLWPAGLHLDWDVPLRTTYARPDVMAGAALLAAWLTAGALVLRRGPFVAIALLFYPLMHVVESGMVPIRDVAFEYRAYLPDAGLCLLVAWGAAVETRRYEALARVAALAMPIVLVALGVVAWRRNEVWRQPERFWRDNEAHAPEKARPYGILGRWLLDNQRPAEALPQLDRAARLRWPDDAGAENEMTNAVNLMWALRELGRYDDALALAARYAGRHMSAHLRAQFFVNEGDVEFERGQVERAERSFRAALEAQPGYRQAIANLASVCAQSGRWAESESLYTVAMLQDSTDRTTRVNLAQVQGLRALERAQSERVAGRREAAASAYREALLAFARAQRDDPDNSALAAYVASARQQLDSLGVGGR